MALLERWRHDEITAVRVGWPHRRQYTSCYFFKIGSTLIDTGPANQQKKVLDLLRGASLKHILLTHYHEDHCGNAAPLQKHFGIPVYIHESALAKCQAGFPMAIYRRLVWGTPERFEASPYSGAVDTEDGFTLIPIHTPGHSSDLVCLLEPHRRWLFTGDVFLTTRPRLARREEDPVTEIESLRKLLQFDFETLFCAHRGKVDRAPEQLRSKLEFLERLREQVRSRRQRGMPVSRITAELLGKETFLSFFSGFDYCKRNLIVALARGDSVIPAKAGIHLADGH